MKLINIKKIIFLLNMAFVIAGCNSSPEMSNDTTWKLAGIVDTKTGDMKVLEPNDCEECYTLTFDSDSTAISRSINITQKLNLSNLYNPDGTIWYGYIPLCEKYKKDSNDYCDAAVFVSAIHDAETYSITHSELRLFYFYADRNYYLLFKPVKK